MKNRGVYGTPHRFQKKSCFPRVLGDPKYFSKFFDRRTVYYAVIIVILAYTGVEGSLYSGTVENVWHQIYRSFESK